MSIEDITEATTEFEEYWDGALGGFIETAEEETLHVQITENGLLLQLESFAGSDSEGTSELRNQGRLLSWEELKALVANR